MACGSSDGGSGASGVLGQALHCPEMSVLRIEGRVGAGEIADTRLDSNINAGLENIGSPRFYTPVSTLAPLAGNQLDLELNWPSSLFYGDTSAADGILTLPANHPDANKSFCVTKAEVGFVDGGVEDGVFKFAVSELKSCQPRGGYPQPYNPPSDPSDEKLAVDIRGCFR